MSPLQLLMFPQAILYTPTPTTLTFIRQALTMISTQTKSLKTNPLKSLAQNIFRSLISTSNQFNFLVSPINCLSASYSAKPSLLPKTSPMFSCSHAQNHILCPHLHSRPIYFHLMYFSSSLTFQILSFLSRENNTCSSIASAFICLHFELDGVCFISCTRL